jgi:xanthine dehydrogenase molybdenum-binding subunit
VHDPSPEPARHVPDEDALAKACGSLRYATDLTRPGLLHAHLVLSPHAHADILSVDAPAILATEGVVGVYSYLNSPDAGYCRYRILPNQPGCIDDETLFARTARCVGDRVAAVVATTCRGAREAAARLEIRYRPRPALLDADSALATGAGPIHPGGNLVHQFVHEAAGNGGPVDSGVTTQTVVSTQMLHHAALEPHTCLADWDASGRLTIWSPCQSVYGVRTVVADLLRLPYSRVRVIKVPMGGSFGGKQEAILEPVTAFLAMQTGGPVQLTLDREQCVRGTMVRPAQRSDVRTFTSLDGRLVALDVDTLLTAGGYATSSPDYAEAMTKKLTRLYRIGRYRHTGRVAYTNTPVAGGMRGWGAPDIATCFEVHLDQVARALRMDPLELRRRNLVAPHDIDPVSGLSVGDARIRDCLERGARAFGWTNRATLEPGSGRFRRGVGVACGAHKNGMYGSEFPETSSMTLKMNEDGSLDLNATIHEVGAGSLQTLRTIVARVLDVPAASISAGEADSETSPFDFGCFGSRVTYVCGAAAHAIATLLLAKLTARAALLLGIDASSVVARDGRVRASDGRSLAYGEVVVRSRMVDGSDMIVTHTHRAHSNPGSYSVQFAGVEVDTLTGLVRVTDMVAAVDIGRALDRGRVEGQCRGGIQAGIGSALCEEVKLDEAGRPAAGGLRNYHIINAADMPAVTVVLVEHDGDEGPFGAKSVGEIATVPTAAAVVNAVNHALGTSLATLPLTPERILGALGAEGHA